MNRILIIGTAHSWFRQIARRIHIDQILEACAVNCPHLRRLEIQWDPETIRFSENSSKFIDHLRYSFFLIIIKYKSFVEYDVQIYYHSFFLMDVIMKELNQILNELNE